MTNKTFARRASYLAAALLVLLGGAEIARRQADLPSLPVLFDLQFDLTPRSQTWRLYDAVPLARSSQPRALALQPQAVDGLRLPWSKGSDIGLADFLDVTHTRAMVVIQDGRIAFEHYAAGFDANSRFASFSVAKSFVATLTGAALAEGRIKSLDDPISTYLGRDEISPAYADITIGQLLDMRSGIDVDERYGGSLTSPVVRMYLSRDLGSFIARRKGLRFAPGSRQEYRSVDTLVLSRVLARATGKSLSAYARETLWQPLGMEQDATWSVDSDAHRIEKAFCCINTTARDFARLGLLYLDEGRAGTRQVVSAKWADTPRQVINGEQKLAYRDGWWIPPGNAGDRDFSAIGVFGQYVYVNPATHTVIVKLSDHGVEQDEIETLLAMRQLSHVIAGLKPN
ncbi:serine hydrolase domain-containing protein [Herbaspirillum sp. alder98]|uniref:serine hydrolase domain-containing protein n=1 Tax=Herbaspirillum sp. alder98 TaxID=2913096 RepID=UPI001CD90BBE|nr:serine hydrolase [Herbaspirillum sp. alder98]MCA1324192.1 beta-lactamase family protein [Herbaspirillum sp. alder98]